MAKKVKLTDAQKVRKLQKELRHLSHNYDLSVENWRVERGGLKSDINRLQQQLADKSDALLPQKAAVLKELAYLTNATARAVRTSMWSLTPVERRGFGR